jgi:hypothetical protein
MGWRGARARPKGTDCKSVGVLPFGGSNPPLSTTMKTTRELFRKFYTLVIDGDLMRGTVFTELIGHLSAHYSHYVFDDPLSMGDTPQWGDLTAIVCDTHGWRYLCYKP